MYVIIVPIQIKEGYKDAFIEAMLDDAKGSVNDEPGCLRFDVIQDVSTQIGFGSTRFMRMRQRSRRIVKPLTSLSGEIPSRTGPIKGPMALGWEVPTFGRRTTIGNRVAI